MREIDQLQTAIQLATGERVDEEDRRADELEQIDVALLEPVTNLVELPQNRVDNLPGFLFAWLLQEEPNDLLLILYRAFSAKIAILLFVAALRFVPFLRVE